ncbi:fibronectin type III domain-containing protein [Actinoplanes nipponensis]|uniref:fibronectin type III domain-containing protein n=1 Tax=Actinoplanes nipponensis TaxID=135950 RepID=UPI0034DB4061
MPTTAGSGTTVLTATDADGDRVTASVPWQVLPARRPGLPLGVSVTGGNGTALLQWAKPSYTFGDVLVTGYVVRVSPGVETTLAASARSLTLTGLDTRRAYTVGLRATSAIGDGAEKTVTLSPTALPLTVTPAAFGYGKSATLTGQVLRGRAAIAGTTATLEQRAAGRNGLEPDHDGADRREGGLAGHGQAVGHDPRTRIRYAGSSGAWGGDLGGRRRPTVRYTVTIKASTTRPKAGKEDQDHGYGEARAAPASRSRCSARWAPGG